MKKKDKIRALKRLLRKVVFMKESPHCWIYIGQPSAKYPQLTFDKKQYLAHRLSYMIFKGRIPEEFEIDHLCFNHRCFRPSHLEAVDSKTNKDRAVEHGCYEGLKQGENNHNAILSKVDVVEIINKLNNTTLTMKEIGQQYGVHRKKISDIKKGKTWSHVEPNAIIIRPKREAEKYIANHKLVESQVKEIRLLKHNGFTYKQLSNLFDVSMHTIWSVVSRRAWKHVE